jgi:K(+)-stimulated pyrophosphate-energized sodium pump
MGQTLTYIIPVFGVLALLFTFWKSAWVSKQEVGTDRMARIAKNIADGAMAFLKAEYRVLIIFVLIVAILLGISAGEDSSWLICCLLYSRSDLLCLGRLHRYARSYKANVRTTNAARTSLGKALEVAFAGGSVMGLGVVGLDCTRTGYPYSWLTTVSVGISIK